MNKLLMTVPVLATAVAVGVAAPAVAADSAVKSVATGSYSAATSSFSCTGHIHDDGNGGTLSLKVSANELRLEDRHFRVASASTRVIAQEKSYSGRWVRVKRGARLWSSLGGTVDEGSYNRSWVVFGSTTAPTLSLTVHGQDDLFRLESVTLMYDDEGNQIARLVNHEGNCRV